jgi:hypothetical protein
MRQPGSTGTCILAIVLGGFTVLLGLGLGVVVTQAQENTGELLGGAVSLAGLGVVVAGWGAWQLRLPIPLDPPPQPSRLWVWLVALLAVLFLSLLVAAAGFTIMYFLHEM